MKKICMRFLCALGTLSLFLLFVIYPIFSFAHKKKFDVSAIKTEGVYPLAVIGGGAAGCAAALYGARAGYQVALIKGNMPGGLITQSHSVKNWLGSSEIDGAKLGQSFLDHATSYKEVVAIEGEVEKVDFSSWPYTISIKDRKQDIKCLSVIVALGAAPVHLNVPGEKTYWGRGVTNCATCDGELYREKVVGVVGGGDSAIVEVDYLSRIAKKVYLFVRGPSLRAKDMRKEEVLSRQNVEVFYEKEVSEIKGDEQNLTHVKISGQRGAKNQEVSLDGLFLAIGHKPATDLFKKQLRCDKEGYITLSSLQETSVPGVFAAGDIVDPYFKQALTAAGDGVKAGMRAIEFLAQIGYQTPRKNKESDSQESVDKQLTEGKVISILSLEELEEEVGKPIILKLFATWCSTCTAMKPDFEEFAKKHPEYTCLEADGDKAKSIKDFYKSKIRGYPTILFIDEQGELLGAKVGSMKIKQLEDEAFKLFVKEEPKEEQTSVVEETPLQIPKGVQHVRTMEELQQLYSYHLPIILDVYASWCGPCKVMKPLFEQIASELQGQIICVSADYDAAKEVANTYRISSFPTFIFLSSNGAEQKRRLGSCSKGELLRDISNFVRSFEK